jgi:hypothetical protein
VSEKTTLIQDLEAVASEMADKWDVGMKAGKLLAHLEGRLERYDPRITRIREALEAADKAAAAQETAA